MRLSASQNAIARSERRLEPPSRKDSHMVLPILVVYVRKYWRNRLGRWEHVRAHTRRWPKT